MGAWASGKHPDAKDLPWKDGQILGISSRKGLTPIIVQIGTLSTIDHVGVVFIEDGKAWLYEFVSPGGFQKISVEDVWERSRGLNGKVNFILGELPAKLNADEIGKVKSRFIDWINMDFMPSAPKPKTCIEAVEMAFRGVRDLPVQKTPATYELRNIFEKSLHRITDRVYGPVDSYPIIATLFHSMNVLETSLQKPFLWKSLGHFLQTWNAEGDFAKLSLTVNKSAKDESVDVKILAQQTKAQFNREVKAMSCIGFYRN